MFCLSSLEKAKIFDLRDFKINEFCNLWLCVGLKESYQNLGERTLLCCFWPGIRSRKCPRSQEAGFHKSSLILANSGGLETTAGSYMTLITWKREGGKKSCSSVFEGFLIADKQPKFCRTNPAHICPRCCSAVRDAKPGALRAVPAWTAAACESRQHRSR